MKIILKYRWLFLMATIIALLITVVYTQHTKSPAYPKLLVEADSAFVDGNYLLADSLLHNYDKDHVTADEPTRMYRNFLKLTKEYTESKIKLNDLVVVDSISTYFEKSGETEKYVRSLLFRGSIYSLVNDIPSSLKSFLTAEKMLKETKQVNSVLMCWIAQDAGDLYFHQKMYDECKTYYRKFYNISYNRQDSLRMAHAYYRMGRFYMIPDPYNNEFHIDSIEHYLQESIQLAKDLPQANNIIPAVQHTLCDIYIQTEQFDKALAIMPRDELNLDNWAYWHYGQDHADSAIYYFRQLIGKSGPAFDAEYLRILTQLERERGNTEQELADYQALLAAEDSAQAQSQAEATRQAAALHEYETIVAERDAIARRNHRLVMLIGIALAIVAVLLVGLTVFWRLRKAKERRTQQLQNLTEGQTVEHPQAASTDEEQLNRQQMQAEKEQHQRLQEALEGSDVYRRLMTSAPGTRRQLSDDEWLWLGGQLDALHHDMGQQLQRQARLSPTELRLCYLTRLGLTSTEMADVLCKSVSAVSHARYRMSNKILGNNADINDLTELIMRY